MIISIDESGSFAESDSVNSWCTVAAYVIPERIQSRSFNVLRKLKCKYCIGDKQEIKLKHLTEDDYFIFLRNLGSIGGALFIVATDSLYNKKDTVNFHKQNQAEKIRENIPQMKYEEGKNAVRKLANDIESLSPQLYVQLQCQVRLIEEALSRGILYFVQRDPMCLRRFKWRIDQKNTSKTVYEEAFQNIAPGILQSISFRRPMYFLIGADYSHFKEFEYTEGEVPSYIEEAIGLKLDGVVNIGKILRDDMSFPDSKKDLNVQIADLLASGIYRCLRAGFKNNSLAARLLGSLMIQNSKEDFSIRLLGFSEDELVTDKRTGGIIRKIDHFSRRMLV
jgi:hypothetical protein